MNMLALMNAAEMTRTQCDRAVGELLLTEITDRNEIAATLSMADKVIGLLAHELRSVTREQEAPEPAPERPAKPAKERRRAPKGQGQHRHSFGSEGVCSCGAKRQRAPKGGAAPAERPSAEARTAPLPLGDHAPDRFDGGAFGSSSVAGGRR